MTQPGPEQPPAELLELIMQAGQGSLVERMGIVFTSVANDRLEATMPVDGNRQPYGLLHGGASCVLAETLASMGAALNAWPERIAMGIEINASHHRSATEGLVRGVATPLRLGRTLSSWAVDIDDAQGRRVCTARVTCVLRETP
ncbi:MAG TPA: hotdog fold thioesterase [Mycobacteriales bacterium]|nr:hotdog fold thioesterase [Mycobacteriales bacterium]